MTEKSIRQRMKDALDKQILDTLENGLEVEGENGETRRVPPPAAFMNVAVRWYQQSDGGDDDDKDSLAARFQQLTEARKAGGKMPDVDTEADDGAMA